MDNRTDPTSDIDELYAIRRSNELELDLIDSWLRRVDEVPENLEARQNLLELRSLCLLRNKLVTNIEIDHLMATGAA